MENHALFNINVNSFVSRKFKRNYVCDYLWTLKVKKQCKTMKFKFFFFSISPVRVSFVNVAPWIFLPCKTEDMKPTKYLKPLK